MHLPLHANSPSAWQARGLVETLRCNVSVRPIRSRIGRRISRNAAVRCFPSTKIRLHFFRYLCVMRLFFHSFSPLPLPKPSFSFKSKTNVYAQQTVQINGTDRASTIAAIITIIRMQHLRLRFFFASLIDSSRCLFASFTRAEAFEIYTLVSFPLL